MGISRREFPKFPECLILLLEEMVCLLCLTVTMLKIFGTIAALAAAVRAHGDHGSDQEPLQGPHKSLWYNTLPGDGGTQVRAASVISQEFPQLIILTGGFSLLWHLDFRPSTILPMPRDGRREVRHCLHRSSFRHRHIIPTRCSFWTKRNQTG